MKVFLYVVLAVLALSFYLDIRSSRNDVYWKRQYNNAEDSIKLWKKRHRILQEENNKLKQDNIGPKRFKNITSKLIRFN
nr:MAG TPA: cell division protein [Caudoviricetes sp.]